MEMTKAQKKEMFLEYLYKNKNKLINEGKEFKEMSLIDRNMMKTVDPQLYKQKKNSYNTVMEHMVRNKHEGV